MLWGVDVVDISFSDSDSDSDSLVSRNVSLVSSFCSSVDDFAGSPDTGSPVVVNGGSSHKAFRGQVLSFSTPFLPHLFLINFKAELAKYSLIPKHLTSTC